jgi:hypothetical protein
MAEILQNSWDFPVLCTKIQRALHPDKLPVKAVQKKVKKNEKKG